MGSLVVFPVVDGVLAAIEVAALHLSVEVLLSKADLALVEGSFCSCSEQKTCNCELGSHMCENKIVIILL